MTDQNLTADLHPEDMEHARAYVQDCLDATYAPDRTLAVARVLQALLPAPSRPTLADMTDDERAACQWMQADVENHDERYAIVHPYDFAADTTLISADGGVDWVFSGRVTPRPDLPRLEWPTCNERNHHD